MRDQGIMPWKLRFALFLASIVPLSWNVHWILQKLNILASCTFTLWFMNMVQEANSNAASAYLRTAKTCFREAANRNFSKVAMNLLKKSDLVHAEWGRHDLA